MGAAAGRRSSRTGGCGHDGAGPCSPPPRRRCGHGAASGPPFLVLLLLAGVVLAAVGLGVGVPHLRRDGVGAGDVLGPAALVVGVLIVVPAAAGLVWATPRWWRLVTVPALAATVVAGVYVPAVPIAAAVPARAPTRAHPWTERSEERRVGQEGRWRGRADA